MKVAFDTRPTADPAGVGRYARCLLRALADTAAASDELIEVRRQAATLMPPQPDVFHSPWIDGAMLHSPCPMIVTIHDLAALKRRSEHLRTGMRLRLRHLAVQRAVSVIVPTEAVAEDAVRHLRLERERVVVIAEAADPAMYPRTPQEIAEARAELGLPERYLLWVGGLRHPDPGKHIPQLAAAKRTLPLVLAGPTRPWAHELPDVLLTGELDDDRLAAVYSGAHALVLPSENGGFGLAGVEALACGTPVVACDTPALRESLGARAQFVAPGDMRALIEAAEATERPAPPAQGWSWEDAARATWGVYTRAAETETTRAAQQRARRRRPAGPAPADGLEA